MISNWWIDAAPWRIAVPRQSAPVSPPPMITTCLPCGGDRRLVEVALLHPVGPRQVLHRLVDAVELATRVPAGRATPSRRPRARPRRTVLQVVDRHVLADVRVRPELRALGFHLVDAAVEVTLLHLELGNAVAQQAADAVGALEHRDVVTRARQLLRGGEPGRAAADDRDPLAGLASPARPARRSRPPTPRSTISTSICLIVTGGSLMPSTHAASHGAGHRRPGELGKVVRGVQPLDSRPPSDRGTRGRSTRGSGSRAGSRCGRTGCRSPCSARPACAPCRPGSLRRPRCQSCDPHRNRPPRRQLPVVLHEPVVSPMCRHAILAAAMTASSTSTPRSIGVALGFEHALVVLREDLRELFAGCATSSRGCARRPPSRSAPCAW